MQSLSMGFRRKRRAITAGAFRAALIALALVVLVLIYRQPARMHQGGHVTSLPQLQLELERAGSEAPITARRYRLQGDHSGLRAEGAGALRCILTGADSGADHGFLAGLLLAPLCAVAGGMIERSTLARPVGQTDVAIETSTIADSLHASR